ncbi:hypothetical protein [Endozoicomonas sp. 4G]|uniref:hypothetical protein n=1 Tax=Endozoicomonas sp. 4G TaxID=2872754 RepID=UPI002078DF65|nr:hypothetical protein [Endozoicomonas sp. 4G]
MDPVNNDSGNADSFMPPAKSTRLERTRTGVSMGRDVTVNDESEPLLLNFLSVSGAGQSVVSQNRSQCVQSTSDETAWAFSKRVCVDEKCLSDESSVKKNGTALCPLALSINELKEVTNCHDTAQVIKKYFTKNNPSEFYVFSLDDQDAYKKYINSESGQGRLFIHKLRSTAYGDREYYHHFVILRNDEGFQVLQSMVGAFTLEQWLTGDSSMIKDQHNYFKEWNDAVSLHRKTKLPTPFSEKTQSTAKKYHQEFRKIKPSFDKIVKTRKNQSVSKAVFNQKVLPELFSALKNSDDRPFFRLFSFSRNYLRMKPEDKVFLEVEEIQLDEGVDRVESHT